MIFSEALIMAEELTKDGSPERESAVGVSAASTDIPDIEKESFGLGERPLPGNEKRAFGFESESEFVHVDASSREEEEEEHHEEEHESPLGSPTEMEKSDFGLEDLSEPPEEHSPTLSEMHSHVEAYEDDQAPEQDVTDDAEDEEEEDADDAPEHDVTSAHEIPGTTIIELSPAEDIDDALEEDESLDDAQEEEDLTEAVVEAHYEDDDIADAEEVDEQITIDEPHDQPAAT
jgi:hypothetical protein